VKAKTFSILTLFSCAALLADLSAEDNPPAPAAPPPFIFVNQADPSAADIAQFGFKTIESIGGALVAEVAHEIATKDTSLAVSIMHLKKLELPKPVAGQPRITAIRRTSLLVRDPQNAPDAADQAALALIQDQLSNGDSPDKMLVQRIENPGRTPEWRVYRPIASSQSCLACHGDPKTFRPGVKAALDLLYPEDKATNYTLQAWRGVIRVSIAPAEPAAK
jgi:hypothetical protein